MDYISRDDVLRKFIEGDGDDDFTIGYNFAVNEHKDKVKSLPAADVQPVKRGRWIAENRDNRGYADCYTCSNCQSYTYTYTLMRDCEYDYCPNCGAKMNEAETIKG